MWITLHVINAIHRTRDIIFNVWHSSVMFHAFMFDAASIWLDTFSSSTTQAIKLGWKKQRHKHLRHTNDAYDNDWHSAVTFFFFAFFSLPSLSHRLFWNRFIVVHIAYVFLFLIFFYTFFFVLVLINRDYTWHLVVSLCHSLIFTLKMIPQTNCVCISKILNIFFKHFAFYLYVRI